MPGSSLTAHSTVYKLDSLDRGTRLLRRLICLECRGSLPWREPPRQKLDRNLTATRRPGTWSQPRQARQELTGTHRLDRQAGKASTAPQPPRQLDSLTARGPGLKPHCERPTLNHQASRRRSPAQSFEWPPSGKCHPKHKYQIHDV